MKKFIPAIFLTIAMAFALCACSGGSSSSDSEDTGAKTEEATENTADDAAKAEETAEKTEAKADEGTAEQRAALNKAETYSEMMHMSYQGIYDQLTSEYGEQFAPEDAQWAMDHLTGTRTLWNLQSTIATT